ncbi:adenylate kinase family-like protein [Striga asiatica]|uniref:adenylate kinase n=1 Tax=Striga asiatica TaxID=4170 RepID=A0A5A7PKI7_STRAF|nr:adenylate kinase family-like protein [Striga asiatica]
MSVISRLGVTARLASRLRRAYGSNAAAQLDYYYYDEEEDGNRAEMAESEFWETPGRSVQWVIMGDPTVIRHVYAQRLAKLLDVPHISMGSLVRQELNPNSPLYKKIAAAVNQEKLVPEDIIFGLLSKRLEEGYREGENGFILDGIPRTRMQAEILDQIAHIDLVVNLKCTEECVVKKTLGGGIYSSPLNLNLQPNAGPCQSSSVDSDPNWKEKLHMFSEKRKPLEEYYKQQKKLVEFQVGGAPGDPWNGLLAALHLPHMNTNNVVTSPHKLMP